MDTKQSNRPTEQRRRSASQSGNARTGAPASSAQRRPGTAAPKRRSAPAQRSGAAQTSIPRRSDSLTDTRRRTQKKEQGILAKLKKTDVPLHLVAVIRPEEYAGKTTAEIADMVYEMMIADLGEEFRYIEN